MNCEGLLKQNLTCARDLKALLKLDDAQEKKLEAILNRFPMSITPYYLSLINFSDPVDPIAKMCIPSIEETDLEGSFDTSGEASNTVMPGMQHKYKQTAMILSTNRCAMYCRHCFRKRLVGLSDDEIATHIGEMADYIRSHTEISNALISGGDSFLNSNRVIGKYLEALHEIEHLDFIRFGTRIPVVLPERISEDSELLELLRRYGKKKQIYVVTHFNHPRELTPESYKAIKALLDCGIVLKNQTVLLRGVNDDGDTLGLLLRGLTRWGVSPYYIFQCRPVTGVKGQFQVPLMRGFDIVEQAKAMQNGQGKNLRYAMSHETGKIEILGKLSQGMVFKYQQAKDEKDRNRMFLKVVNGSQCWLDEKEP